MLIGVHKYMKTLRRALRITDLFLAFLAAFLPRFALWIYPGYGWKFLTIYDVKPYTVFGRELVSAFLTLDFKKAASINVGVPPLGMFVIGLCSLIFKNLLDIYRAGLLAPILTASFSALLVYLLLERFSRKAAIIASLLFALDPYLVQFSGAYLDAIGSFFVLIAMYFFLSSDKFSLKSSLATGFFMMLAILTKLTFAIFAAFFMILLILVERNYRLAGIIIMMSLFLLPLTPWLWFPDIFQKAVTSHILINSLLPPIIFGPVMIGIPEAYPWYILTYFGMGQIHWNVLPSASHFLLFCVVIYCSLNRSLRMNRKMLIFLLASILMVVFMPRNYWTTVWLGGIIVGEGVLFKQFYPYYFYSTNLVTGVTACYLLFVRSPSNNGFNNGRYSILLLPVIFYCLTAPLTVVMSAFYPYWDLIFTLIMNFSIGSSPVSYYGFVACVITSMILLLFFIFSIAIAMNITKGER